MTFLVLSFWIYTLVLVFGARLGYDSHEVVMIVTSCLIYESFGITCPCVCMSNLWSVCLFYQNPWHDHILYIFIMICMNWLWHPMNFLCLYNLYSERTVHRVSVFLASDMVRYCPYHIFGVSDAFGWEIRRWWCGRHGWIDLLVISKKMERSQRARERWMGSLMGDAPFACLLMSHSLMGHHDQRQESSWKLFEPINDSWPFIVIKVKKSNGSYSNLG
jgi:hypothetical protein